MKNDNHDRLRRRLILGVAVCAALAAASAPTAGATNPLYKSTNPLYKA